MSESWLDSLSTGLQLTINTCVAIEYSQIVSYTFIPYPYNIYG